MHIFFIAALTFFGLGALGAPTQASPLLIAAEEFSHVATNPARIFDATVFQRSGDAIVVTGTNDCWDFNYSYNTTGVSNWTATVANCQQIVLNYASNTEWTANPGDIFHFVYDDCHFSVQNPEPPSLNPQPGPASFGNGDVVHVIEKLIERNQGNGHVAGWGAMTCPDLEDDVSTQALKFYLGYNFALDDEVSDTSEVSARDSATTLFRKSDDEADTEHCWDYTISPAENTTSDSPLVADCEQMLTNIASDGDWMLGWRQTRQLVQYGTCAFTAENNYPGRGFVRVGNVDIIHVVSVLIDQNASPDGRVGGAGFMNCSDIHKGNSDYLMFWLNRNDLSLAPEIPEIPGDGGDVSAPQQSAETGLAARDSDTLAGATTRHCNDDAFWGETSSNSPLTADCQQMLRNIAGDGDWSVLQGSHRLIQYQSCAVNAYVEDPVIVMIGNSDLIRIGTAMIEAFADDSKVGSHGEMWCDTVMEPSFTKANIFLVNSNQQA